MVFNALSVATAVTPAVLETYFSHFLHRAPLRQKPTAHISYHEGLSLIRQFLDYASKHTVEDVQGFTAQWVPAPTWVRTQDVEIAPQFLQRAARVLSDEMGWKGIERVGGETWWQWRRPESPLRAEWIEMRKDYQERKRTGEKCDRVILYIHGGAYYFGSVDEHRYQMQRHARKLRARVLAPRYRLAPQFPFPCGLYDCLATYLYLLEHFPREQILFGGDSAGGGMVLSLLVVLRDQGLPLPAGTILLSPWVDLTHSFPSVAGDGVGDYIPPHGFLHRPSMAWPPLPSDELRAPHRAKKTFERPSGAVELPVTSERQEGEGEAVESSTSKGQVEKQAEALPGVGETLCIMIGNEKIELKEQIQLYAPNYLLACPFVSPVLQPSLGGLPPMLIQVGGSELLRDEQIYLAHKAADPKGYPPGDAVMREYDPTREILNRYPPTDVQLQVWDDLCHVPHTLSFTRPAKYMYRSVAQFGAWALAHAQNKGIDIQDDDAVSVISDGPDTADEADASASTSDLRRKKTNAGVDIEDDKSTDSPYGAVGKAGDPLPPFREHMIRQRVTRHGIIYPLALPAELACLHLDPATIGTVKKGPVQKWLAAKKVNEQKFASEKKKVQKKRAKESDKGYDRIPNEDPPATALVNRLKDGVAPEQKKNRKSWGLAMWSGWGSHHDEKTLEREEKAENDSQIPNPTETTVHPALSNAPPSGSLAIPGSNSNGKKSRRTSASSYLSTPWSMRMQDKDRPRSPYRKVTDAGQAGEGASGSFGSHMLLRRRSSGTPSMRSTRSARGDAPIPVSSLGPGSAPTASAVAPGSTLVHGSENTYLSPNGQRPHNGIVAYPFKLSNTSENPSTLTLHSMTASSPGRSEPVELPALHAQTAQAFELPVAGPLRSTPTSPLASLTGMTRSELPASPASGDQGEPETSQTVGMSPSNARGRNPVFDPRTSVLGRIGADGMPVAPLLARGDATTNSSRGSSRTAPSPAVDTTPWDEAVSPIDADSSKPPFKIRNPVFDPRAPATSAPGTEIIITPQEPPKSSAPFRMRHTIYEPKVASPVSPIQDPGDGFVRAISPTPESIEPVKKANGHYHPPHPADLPPNSNITMPTPVIRTRPRPDIPQPESMPPPPPPKDSKYNESTPEKRKPSVPTLPRDQDDIFLPTASASNASMPPKLGALGFEKKKSSASLLGTEGGKRVDAAVAAPRPLLESFVTAREDL